MIDQLNLIYIINDLKDDNYFDFLNFLKKFNLSI